MTDSLHSQITSWFQAQFTDKKFKLQKSAIRTSYTNTWKLDLKVKMFQFQASKSLNQSFKPN